MLGNWSHWQPERMRKRMPLRARRQLACLRPVAFVGQKAHRMGKIRSHRASGTSQIVGNGLHLGFLFLTMIQPFLCQLAISWNLQLLS